MVSVDDKHHVYLLKTDKPYGFCGVDVKHHVYLLKTIISLMVSVDVKHHLYLLKTDKPYGFCGVDVKHHLYLLNPLTWFLWTLSTMFTDFLLYCADRLQSTQQLT